MSDKRFATYLFLAAGSLLVLINFQAFIYLFTATVIPGWDGSAHLAIGELYAKNIFPSVWGWIDAWYLGMPFPQFYPPALYFLIALCSKIFFFIPYETVFRSFIFITLFLVPGSIAWCGYRVTGLKKVAIWSALVSTVFLSFSGAESNYGVSVSSTINTGLLSHPLGFLFFVAWIRYFFEDYRIRRNYILSTIFLACVFLSNAHLAFPALILFCVQSLFDTHKYVCQKRYLYLFSALWKGYFLRGLISIGIASFWIVPLVTYYQYFSTEILDLSPNAEFAAIATFSYIPFFLLASVLVAFNKEENKIVSLTLSLLALALGIFIGSAFVPSDTPLPLHFVRWIVPFVFLSAIPISYLIVYTEERLLTRIKKELFAVAVLVFLVLASFTNILIFKSTQGVYLSAKDDGYVQLGEYFKSYKGSVVLVEFNSEDKTNVPMSFAVDAMLGREGVQTIFSNIRESSTNSLFLTPIRNLFSENPEGWGVTSFLEFDYGFLNKTPMSQRVSLARYVGVRFIVASTESEIETLAKSPFFVKKAQIGIFGVFELKNFDSSGVKHLRIPPTALFSDEGLKERNETDITFSRFSEEWLYNFDPQLTYFRPHNNQIDDIGNGDVFNNAGAVVLASYAYKDISVAEHIIVTFSQKSTVVMFDDNNPLLGLLRQDHLKNLYILPLPKGSIGGSFRDIYPTIQKILVNSLKSKTTNATLIKKSYFPAWSKTGSEIYQASPSFMLIFGGGEKKDLTFDTPITLYLGYGLSTLALLSLFLI